MENFKAIKSKANAHAAAWALFYYLIARNPKISAANIRNCPMLFYVSNPTKTPRDRANKTKQNKKQMKKYFRLIIGGMLSFILLGGLFSPQKLYAAGPKEQIITVHSDPTPSQLIIRRSGKDKVFQPNGVRSVVYVKKKDRNITLRLRFGNENRDISLQGIPDPNYSKRYVYPDAIYYNYQSGQWDTKELASIAKETDPTIRTGEATNMVSRDAPGQTALERTIFRWYFDSAPRGARIFWRVISSIPDQVKNTNELYLTTTPFEETRSFNILGLTYENSRDVTIEIKLSMPGYHDQVKRYNVRQAIDQQEISGFFDLVPVVQ